MKINEILEVSTANARELIVKSFLINNIRTAQQTMDLTGYQGKPFRLYAEKDGTLSVDQEQNHYWLLAEVEIPEMKMKSVSTGKYDDKGQMIMQSTEVPLDLNELNFTIFALPGGAE